MLDRYLLHARGRDGQIQSVFDIGVTDTGGQLPGDDVAGEVVQHRREIVVAPADDLELAEIGLL